MLRGCYQEQSLLLLLMLFTVVPNKSNYMLISTPCLLDLCQTWLLCIALLSMHRNNSLSITVPWAPRLVRISTMSFTDRLDPHRGSFLRWCPCKVCDVDQQRNPLQQLLHSHCAASQPQMKGFFQQEASSSPTLEEDGGRTVLGARGARSDSPRVFCAQDRISSNSFPTKS